jgi:tetratricopeptide (TPR) repeat protein
MAVDDLYKKACDAVERANYDYAIELFREVLRQNQEYPDARIALRGTERRRIQEKGRSIVAAITAPVRGLMTALKATLARGVKKLETFEDYLEKSPSSFWGLNGAGAAAAKAGFVNEAVLIYRDALKLKPNNKGALRHIGNLLVRLNEHEEALRYLNRLAQLEPRNRDLQREVRDLAATEHMSSHDMEGARSFRDLIRDKDVAEALEQDGRMAVTMDDLGRQLQREEKELEEHPDNVNRIIGVAKLYIDLGRMKDAQELLRRKHKDLPDSYEIREHLGDVQLVAYQQAILKAEAALEADPDDAAARAKRDQLKKRYLDFAIKDFHWRLAQHPTDRELQFKLAMVQFEGGNYNEAIAGFQIAAQDARYEVESRKMLGRSFMKKGQADLALEQFDQAIKRHPQLDDQGKDLYYHQAEAFEQVGRDEEAGAIYKRIYSTDINFRDVARKVDALSR